MRVEYLPTKEILDFEKEIGCELIVTERPNNGCPKFYARFDSSEIKEGCMLSGAYGNGQTVNEAIRSYAYAISNKLLVIDAWNFDKRREINCPKLIHTKLACE